MKIERIKLNQSNPNNIETEMIDESEAEEGDVFIKENTNEGLAIPNPTGENIFIVEDRTRGWRVELHSCEDTTEQLFDLALKTKKQLLNNQSETKPEYLK